jgi:acetyl-CoA C-acetyltransferase
MNSKTIYICCPLRTAIGSFNGALSSLSAPQLGATLIKTLISKTKLSAESIDEVILGSVLTAGQGQAPARQVVINGGLSNAVQAMTINKVCSSGLKAVQLASDRISLGHSEAVIAGGMESMTNAPYLLPTLRSGAKLGNSEAVDSLIHDALWDVYNSFHMGNAAELCVEKYKFSREAQDEFAIASYEKANKAIRAGWFKDEIVAVQISRGKETISFDTDEEPLRFNKEKIPQLKPTFKKDGTVTPANASSINDGASLMIVCSEKFAKENNLEPVARIVEHGWYGQAPEWFTTSPVGAVNTLLKKSGTSVEKIDLFEVNEAFAAVAMACRQELKIPEEKLNVCGGAVALGHPVGASGARILTTLIHSLKRLNLKTGVASLCNGGGEATSILIERV